jgi:simple sugar transport system permease protein
VSSTSVAEKDNEVGLMQRIVRGSALTSVLAVVVSLILGGLLIALTDQNVWSKFSYFFARPTDTLKAGWDVASDAYVELFKGAVFNSADGFAPIAESLAMATPLALAGLGVAVAFRSGLFNIGAQGQIIVGAILASYAGFAWHLPIVLHLLVVIIMAALGGAVFGGIVGWLKAATGAHEVILTIMLNYVGLRLLDYVLSLKFFLPKDNAGAASKDVLSSAEYPVIIPGTRLDLGFIVALIAVAAVWWLMNRSTLGLELRAVGENPSAARTAGINVKRTTFFAMAIAGLLAGLAASAPIAGTEHRLTLGVAGSIGFDAITVALLGRSTPVGTLFAAILFGAFRAGASNMQITTGVSNDIVLVVQSLIVLFIAAPPLVRTIFGLNRVARDKKKDKPTPPKKQPVAAAAESTEGGAA